MCKKPLYRSLVPKNRCRLPPAPWAPSCEPPEPSDISVVTIEPKMLLAEASNQEVRDELDQVAIRCLGNILTASTRSIQPELFWHREYCNTATLSKNIQAPTENHKTSIKLWTPIEFPLGPKTCDPACTVISAKALVLATNKGTSSRT